MAFAGTKVLEIVKKTTGGLVWKQWAMNSRRRANAKKRARRVAQVEAVLRACAGPPPAGAEGVNDNKEQQNRVVKLDKI